MASEQRKSLFEGNYVRFMIEIFSLTSTGLFILSAIINSSFFLLVWRINYFSIASPSDVVMSGFVPMGSLSVLLIGTVLLFLAVAWLVNIIANIRIPYVSFRTIIVAVILGSQVIGLAAFCISIIQGQQEAQERPSNDMPSAPISPNESPPDDNGATPPFPFNLDYSTGLYVHSPKLPLTCKLAKLGWAGSSAVVIKCQDHDIVVLHNPQDLVTSTRADEVMPR